MSDVKRSGLGLLATVQVVFLILKLADVIHWHWGWVLAPWVIPNVAIAGLWLFVVLPIRGVSGGLAARRSLHKQWKASRPPAEWS